MTTPAYDQVDFRGRDDDVALNSTTFNGGGGLSTNWNQNVDTNFRVRFTVAETGGAMVNNTSFELWYDLNSSGTYAVVTASTPVQPADTTQYATNDTTTQVIGDGTYTVGDSQGGVDNTTDTGLIDFSGNDEAEMEWCLTIDSAQVSNGNTIDLRVRVSGGTVLNAYTVTPQITVVEAATPTYDQDAFRGRDDDVALNSGTFNGGGGLNTNWTQDVNTNFRVRFVVQETAGGTAADQTFTLFYSYNSGTYTEINTGTLIRPADTTQYTNGATTTQVIGSGTYVTGESAGGVDNAEDTGNVDFGGSDEAEIEFCLQIISGQVADEDTIALRVYHSDGTALATYTNTPTITVNDTVGGIDLVNLGVSDDTTPVNPDINDGVDATSFSNTSWTPPTTGVIIAFVEARDNASGQITPTMSGNSLTWTQIGSTYDADSGGGNGISLFCAIATGATTGATTVDFGSNTQVHCVVSFFQLTGIDDSGGASGVFQQNQQNNGTGTSGSVTMNAAADSDNRVIALLWHQAEENVTLESSFTQIDDNQGPGQTRDVLTFWRADAFDTTPGGSWTTSSDWGIFAAEVKVATGNKTASIADTVGITDTVTTSIDYVISTSDSVGITDTLVASVGKVVSLANSVGITDVLSASVGKVASLADSVGITDTLTNVLAYARSISETVGITDTLTKVDNFFRNISNSVGITDTSSEALGYSRTVNDPVGITDVMSASIKKIVALADAVGITDAVLAVMAYARSIANPVGVTDSDTEVLGYSRSISNSVGITDTLAKVGQFFKSFSNSVGITDTINAVVKVVATIADSVGITDTTALVGAYVKSFSEPVGVTDTLSTARNLVIAFSNAVGITDVLSTAVGYARSIADAVGITDLIDAIKGGGANYTRSISDSVGITDALSHVSDYKRALQDTVGISDTLASAIAYVIAFSDAIGITDLIAVSAVFFRSIADAVGIADTVAGLVKLAVFINDAVGITDSLSKVQTLVRNISDAVGVTDTLSKVGQFFVSLADSIGVTDSIISLLNYIELISETILKGSATVISLLMGGRDFRQRLSGDRDYSKTLKGKQ